MRRHDCALFNHLGDHVAILSPWFHVRPQQITGTQMSNSKFFHNFSTLQIMSMFTMSTNISSSSVENITWRILWLALITSPSTTVLTKLNCQSWSFLAFQLDSIQIVPRKLAIWRTTQITLNCLMSRWTFWREQIVMLRQLSLAIQNWLGSIAHELWSKI